MNKDYATITLEEYFETSKLAVPVKAIEELKGKEGREVLLSKTLKKYLINARQAQTNAKIVEALLS